MLTYEYNYQLPHQVARMKVKVNDITLNVLLEGDEQAPPVLLLHGFPDSSKMWTGQVLPRPTPLVFIGRHP